MRMHSFVAIFVLLFLTGSVSLASVLPTETEERTLVPLSFDTLYIPSGFDSNDNVQLVGEGFFRNACFSLAPTTVSVDHAGKTIFLLPQAYVYNGPCAQVVQPFVILPFVVEINVGTLEPGTYQILQGPERAIAGYVNVARANRDSVDDFLYAPVSEIDVRQVGAETEIHLSGHMLGSCQRLGEVKTTVENNVITVYPYAYNVAGDDCLRGRFPFSKTIRVRAPAGRYLIHVRAQAGEALNRIVDSRPPSCCE